MSKPIRSILCTVFLLCACGDDDDGGNAGQGGSSGSQAGSGGSGNAGRGGSSAGTGGGGSAGRGGSGAGTGGSSAGTGGSGAGTGGTMGMDAGAEDGGQDSGMPTTATVCKAPDPTAPPRDACPAGAPPALKLTLIKSGLPVPILVTQPPGDDSRLFVVLRNGRIELLDPDDGSNLGTFMTVPGVAAPGDGDPGGEMGLLGLAFHPDYPKDPRFFVNYTDGDQDVTASFEVMADDPDKGDPASGVRLVAYDDPAGNHNGGMLAFGPDGCLFIASGDGGGSNDQHGGTMGNGQRLDTALGKILRIDVDKPMDRAPGNLASASYPHIWSYGWRNPWRFSFDRTTGDMYIGDVGQGAYEEVDVEPKGVGHRNYGWKIMEGEHCRPGGDANCEMDGLTLPVQEYLHTGGNDCIVGGYVYRGSKIAALQGWYLFADNGPGPGPMNSSPRSVWALAWDGTESCQDEPPLISDLNDFNIYSDITSFGEDANGELYITTLNSVYRIDPQ
jgi:glucose/arabinose dehydrogenase